MADTGVEGAVATPRAVKLIDAHHHYWDPIANDHPWLAPGAAIPFRYGDYEALKRPFLPNDYDAVSADFDVVATITMEGEWSPADPLGEANWMIALAQEHGRPLAHSAQIWLDRDDLPALLDAYAQMPLVRAVRHKPRANPAPGGPPGGMTDDAFKAGFQHLAEANLAFDLQTPWWHLDEAIALCRLAPATRVILNHAGLPADRSPEMLVAWRAAITRFAALPNTFVKISGMGLPGRPWRLEEHRDIIVTLADTFGPDRAMVASNFPVDGLCGSYRTIMSGYDAALSGYSGSERHALFGAADLPADDASRLGAHGCGQHLDVPGAQQLDLALVGHGEVIELGGDDGRLPRPQRPHAVVVLHLHEQQNHGERGHE
ncbi:MAG: amidohydrolase family protein, partial [Pseudomonadota bacterium]